MYDDLFNLIDLPILKFDMSDDDIIILEANKSYIMDFNIGLEITGMSLSKLVNVSNLRWMKIYISYFYSNSDQQNFSLYDKSYILTKVTSPRDIVYVVHLDKTEEFNLKNRLERTQRIGKIGDWENNIELNNQKWSEQIYELIGEEPHSFIEDYDAFMAYIHPEDFERVKLVNEKSLKDKEEFSLEFRIIDKNSKTKWMFTRGNFMYDDYNNVKKVYGVMQDISENKRLEMLLLQAIRKSNAANEYKSKFLANMSHEIRTPLGSILGMSKLLLNNNLDMLSLSYTNNIISSGNLLLELVNDILDLSKIESGKMELDEYAFDMNFLIDSLTNIFQGKLLNKDIEYTVDIEKNVPRYLYGDSYKLRQILLNLLGNAIKFTEKGYVKLSVGLNYILDDQVDIKFQVEDSGVGFDSDKIEDIFDDYKQDNSSITRKFGGSGLGLSISKHLISIMGGSINVESKVGHGCRFYFNILFKQSSRKEVEFEEDFFEPLFLKDSISVLVAEDDRVNQIYLKTFLKQSYNFDVTLVADGQMALDAIKTNDFKIVFLDSNMPHLGGIETAKKIRMLEDYKADLSLVALTADAFKGDEEKFLECGFDYYLSKPIDEVDFSRVIKNILKDKIKYPLKDQDYNLKSSRKDGRVLEYKYISLENILEKSDFLGIEHFLVIMEYAIEDYGEKYIEILDDLAQKDIDQIYYKLHSVQGTLVYFSTSELTDLIKNIEYCIKSKEYDNIYDFLNEFLNIFPLFMDELSDFYKYKKSLI